MCRRISPLAALSSAFLLLGACGGQDHRSEWTGTVGDSAGITVVSNPGVGTWTDQDRWVLTEELRTGVASGDPELEFGLIVGLDPDDALDVADLADMQSMDLGSPRWDIFDVDGRCLGSLEMPEGFAPRRNLGDRIYGIHRDELGVQRVMRLTLERGQE